MVTDKGLGKEVNVVVQDGKGGGAHGDVLRRGSGHWSCQVVAVTHAHFLGR